MRRHLVAILCLIPLGTSALLGAEARPDSAAKTIRSLGVKWLVAHQNAQDGSYGKADDAIAGKTGLVVYVLASCQRGYQVVDGPYMSEAVAFLMKQYNRDGSFGRSEDVKLKRFNTAMAIMALAALKTSERYLRYIKNGAAYLARTSGKKPADEILGGLGSVLPGKPGPLTCALLQTQLNVQMQKGGAWLGDTIKALAATQDRKDDGSDTYGMCTSAAKEGLETDPVVATALAIKAADLVKDNYKKLKDKK